MVYAFDLGTALERARTRLGAGGSSRRKRRSDAGASRIAPEVNARLAELLGGQERPAIAAVLGELQRHCRQRGLRCPSRATVYKALARLVVHRYPLRDLPAAVAATLYNLDQHAIVPGHQLAFYCFNYGGLEAMSFAASLPWLALYQAARLRGWRPKSRGLLLAACRARGI